MKRDNLDLKVIVEGLEAALEQYATSEIGDELQQELEKIYKIQEEEEQNG